MRPALRRVRGRACAFAGLALLVLFGQPITDGGADSEPNTWTVMVYMAADAEPALPWQDDINEMEGANITDLVNVIVLVDPLGPSNSVIYEIALDHPGNPVIVSPIVEDDGAVMTSNEVNMASPDTLSRFISFVTGEYPADRLALVLWGHGAGWHGVCADQLNLMSLPSLRMALSQARENLDQMIDLILIDSCMGGTLEMVFELTGEADVLVASETNVPSSGQRYDLSLAALARDTTQTPESWGAKIAEIYRVSMQSVGSAGSMAVFDMNEVDDLSSSLNELGRRMVWHSELYGSRMLAAVLQAQDYDMKLAPDAGHLMSEFFDSSLPHEIRWAAIDALMDYRDIVSVFQACDDPFEPDEPSLIGASGAILYVPNSTDVLYADLRISEKTLWDEAGRAVRDDSEDAANSEVPSFEHRDSDGDGLADAVVVTWEGNHTVHEVWAFVQLTNGMQLYSHATSHEPVITISGAVGMVLISASAGNEGRADSHAYQSVVLSAQITLEVQLTKDGRYVSGSYVVKAYLPGGTVAFSETNGTYALTVELPKMANVSDLVTVQVVDSRSGDIVGEQRVQVSSSIPLVTIEIVTTSKDFSAGWYLALGALTIVGALLIIGIYARGTRRRDDEEEEYP